MKKIVSTLLAVAMALNFSVCAFADGAEFDCASYSSLYDADEFAEVTNDLRGDHIAEEAVAFNAYNGSEGSAYKVYTSNASWFFEKLSEGVSVSELVDDEYHWLLPRNNSVAYVRKGEDNKWEAVGSATAPTDDDTIKSNIVRFDEVNAAINSLEEQSEAKDIRCVNLPEYHSYFVFVTLSDAIYVVPYSTRPDFTGLENGALYTSDEAMAILKQNMGEVYTEGDPNADPMAIPAGGVGYKTLDTADKITASEISRKEAPLLPLVLICAAAIAGGITAAVLIWNRKSKHKQ